jgi:CheY-like chemotaxis protein
VQILFVDNHPEFTAIVVASFLASHEVVIVPTAAGARRALDGADGGAFAAPFDVVLVDFDLDDGKGDELVRWTRSSSSGATTPVRLLPIVAVSARAEGNAALVAAGADATCGKLAFATIESVLAKTVAARVE